MIELILTIALVGGITGMAVPCFSSWRAHHVTRRESQRVQRALERAYITSLRREVPVILALTPGALIATGPRSSRLFSLELSPEVSVNLKSKEQQAITFYPSHTTTPTTIIVSNAHTRCSVILSLRGRTRRECA